MGGNNYSVYRQSSVLFVFFFLVFAPAFAQTDESVQWYRWDEGVDATLASGKYMLVDVYTDWCGWCKKMNREVFGHPKVKQIFAESFILVKLDAESDKLVTNGVTQYTEQELAKMLEVDGYPTVLVYNRYFQLVSRFSGYRGSESFIHYLKYIREKHYTECSFEEYLQRIGGG